jgi:hypothetical protein
MSEEVSTFRLYLLRTQYLITIGLVGVNAWPALINHAGPWDPFVGAGWCLYAAMSALAVLGIRYPLKMLPLLFHQMLYKAIWVVAIGIPTWPGLPGATRAMAIGVLLDLVAIPWPYVFRHYVKAGGDRWGRRSRSISPERAAGDVLSK